MTTTSSTINLTDTKATAGSHTSSAEDDTYATAKAITAGTSSMFLTVSEGLLRAILAPAALARKTLLLATCPCKVPGAAGTTLQFLAKRVR